MTKKLYIGRRKWKFGGRVADYCLLPFSVALDTVQGCYHYEFQKPSQSISLWSYSCSISSSGLGPQLAATMMLKLQDSHPTACRGHCSWQLPSNKWWNFSWEHSSVQLLSCVPLFATLWTAAHQVSLSITNSWSYSNSCPLNWWCDPTIASSFVPFSHLQYFQASGSFPGSQFFTSGGQSIGVSASTSFLPMNT